jgi:hypothetical protein
MNVRPATVADVPAMLGVWRASDEEVGAERQAELVKALATNPELLRMLTRPGVL